MNFKTIGMIGGLSMESTQHYIQNLTDYYKQEIGGYYSPKIAMRTVNFHDIVVLMKKNDWAKIGDIMTNEAKYVEKAGADFLILPSNTIHKVADQVQDAIKIPLLHIAQPTIDALKADNKKNILYLGTKPSMEENFMLDKYIHAEINTFVPPVEEDRNDLHKIIFNELVYGSIGSTPRFFKIVSDSKKAVKADAVVLGCTELEMFFKHYNSKGQKKIFYNTTLLHVLATAKKSIERD